MSVASVLVPVDRDHSLDSLAALIKGAQAQPQVKEVFLTGRLSESDRTRLHEQGVQTLSVGQGRGAAIKAALGAIKGELVILQDANPAYDPADYSRLLAPLVAQNADAVYGVRFCGQDDARPVRGFFESFADAGLSLLCGALTDLSLADSQAGLKAFRTEILRGMPLRSNDQSIDAEIAVKLAAQLFRIQQVPISYAHGYQKERLGPRLQRAFTLMRYATSLNDADNQHEGYNTLLRMEEGAPRYNAWLSRKLSPHLGKRVLEVGAGIGTITKHIAFGRELVMALEMDRFYYERLKNLFAHSPQVVPHLSGVEEADWKKLSVHQFDSVLLSNVLEHIADDRAAITNFHRLLVPNGRLVILVPANPSLFGSIDEAVGHFRRYAKRDLHELLTACGFNVEVIESMNVLGIPGWFINGRILKRRAVPALQLRAYDLLAPMVAEAEARLRPQFGMSLLAVARK